MKSIDKYVLVLVASLALLLAGCGGGSSSTPDEEMTGPTPEEMLEMRMADQRSALETANSDLSAALTPLVGAVPTQAQIDAANTAIGALQAALAGAVDLSDADKAPYQTSVTNAMASVTRAERALQVAQEEAQEEADRVARAMARKLYAGLDNNVDDNGSLSGANTSVTRSGSNLVVDPDTTDTVTAVTVKPSGTTVVPLNGWEGTDYVNTTSGVTNHLVLYSNREATSRPFVTKWGPTAGIDPTTGRVDFATATGLASNIAGSDFSSAGLKAHTEDPGDQESISGTFDGALGTYSCTQVGTTVCTSTVLATGGFTLSGGWFFTPSNPNAMTSTPEASWQVFGWWSRETANGVDVRALVQDAGTAEVLTANPSVGGTDIEGTATYRGGAAGKYSIYNPLGMGSHAGAFTADAELTANFSATAADATISGELTGFRSGDQTMDWTVAFEETAIASGAFSDTTNGTEWTIGDTAAAKSGSWQGDFYDPNTTTGVPGTAAGTFTSEYDSIGHMVGAFGADLED